MASSRWQAAAGSRPARTSMRSEEHTSELQPRQYLVCRLLLEKKKKSLSCLLQSSASEPPVLTSPATAEYSWSANADCSSKTSDAASHWPPDSATPPRASRGST